MAFNPQRHRRWVLASRPHGEPTGENFRLEEGEVASPGPGTATAAHRLSVFRSLYARADERRAFLFAAGRRWRGDGGRHREPRRDIEP